MKKSSICIVKVTEYSGTTDSDKRGESPVMLQIVAGEAPNRNVLSGTVAKRAGFEVGKTYLTQVRLQGIDASFGPQYNWLPLQEIDSAVELVKAQQMLGDAEVENIPRPEGSDYKRKTNAVEGAQSIRRKEGLFKSVTGGQGNHSNTKVIPGSSAADALSYRKVLTNVEAEEAAAGPGATATKTE